MLAWIHRRRFRDLVRRQLDLFEQDHASLLQSAREALQTYHAEHDEHDAQAAYARHDDLSEDVQTLLETMRDSFASSVEPQLARWYMLEFAHQSRRRYRDLLPQLNLPDWKRRQME